MIKKIIHTIQRVVWMMLPPRRMPVPRGETKEDRLRRQNAVQAVLRRQEAGEMFDRLRD